MLSATLRAVRACVSPSTSGSRGVQLGSRQPRPRHWGSKPGTMASPSGREFGPRDRTPLMVLITKVKMVTSRARTARGSPPLPDGLARATCRQCQDQGLRTSVGRNNVNDEATPLPASPRAVAIVPTRCVQVTAAVPVAHRHNPKEMY